MEIKSSQKDSLFAAFGKAASFQKLSRFEKIRRKPISTLFKYALEAIGRFFNFRFPVIAKTFFGDRMKVILPETVSAAIYRYGVHEADLTEYLLKTIGGGDTFIDGGAHYGYFSLLAARLGAEVHSFEPSPSVFKVLEQNARGSNARNIKLNNVALWNTKGNIDFLNLDSASSGGNTAKPREGMIGKMVTVPATSLDSYVKENKISPTFVKLDLEGAELEALRGMDYILSNIKPALTVEVFSSGYGEKPVSDSRKVLDLLQSHGYHPFIYNRGLQPFIYRPSDYFTFSCVILIAKK
ncbi:MAG: hypothetical protein UY21_C0021G0033 [Microgenomates group bacterium GW2011_GWA1_48_10]|nr:MAG: hypothetical protein UY21_C0021G0033 [Microgenomates group bacterium GW2011_GWA1_48_10]